MNGRTVLIWGVPFGVWLAGLLVNYWFVTTYVSGLVPQVIAFVFFPAPYIALVLLRAVVIAVTD